MTRSHYLAKNAPKPAGPYSHGVVANGFLFTCGMGPVNPASGEIEAEGIREQTRQTLKNLHAIVAEQGLDFSSVVKVTAHLKNLQTDFAGYNEVYAEFFSDPFPVRTTVGSDLLGILVEIDLVLAL